MIYDYIAYAETFHKIKTKLNGIQPFILRHYQKDFIEMINKIEGPKRIIVLKPRQAGFTTLTASFFMHLMCVTPNLRGIGLADQHGRTLEMSDIYSNYLIELDERFKPQIEKMNDERIVLDNPNRGKETEESGIGSSIKFGTARDKNAGRAGTRQFAHLTECAFYLYPMDVDEAIQNSIPLDNETLIIKESTANGRQGVGKPFYDLWCASVAGESIYKPYFVPWYKVDDYSLRPISSNELTKTEKEIIKMAPEVTLGNISWRRLKIKEYSKNQGSGALSPEERMKQDFPSTPEEAFLSSGRPVFDQTKMNRVIQELRKSKPNNIAKHLTVKNAVFNQFKNEFFLISAPKERRQYFIGADVAEGLEIGDSSSITIIDDNMRHIGSWKGKIDPDLFGHLLIGVGEYYHNALLTVEKNNMGITTVITIRNEGYTRQYKRIVEDKVTKERKTELGWGTTAKSKMEMLNDLIKSFRDDDFYPLDINLAREMESITRESDGNVILNGMDLTVSACLAIAGWKNYKMPVHTKATKSSEMYDTWKPVKKSSDIFG